MNKGLIDFPCMYYISAKGNRDHLKTHMIILFKMFGLDVEQSVQKSNFFSIVSDKAIDGAMDEKEVIKLLNDSKNRLLSCKGLQGSNAAKKLDLRKNCCLICPYSATYINSHLNEERAVLKFIYEHFDDVMLWLYYDSEDFKAQLSIGRCNNIIAYPIVPFYSILFTFFQEYSMSSDEQNGSNRPGDDEILNDCTNKVVEYIKATYPEYRYDKAQIRSFVQTEVHLVKETPLMSMVDFELTKQTLRSREKYEPIVVERATAEQSLDEDKIPINDAVGKDNMPQNGGDKKFRPKEAVSHTYYGCEEKELADRGEFSIEKLEQYEKEKAKQAREDRRRLKMQAKAKESDEAAAETINNTKSEGENKTTEECALGHTVDQAIGDVKPEEVEQPCEIYSEGAEGVPGDENVGGDETDEGELLLCSETQDGEESWDIDPGMTEQTDDKEPNATEVDTEEPAGAEEKQEPEQESDPVDEPEDDKENEDSDEYYKFAHEYEKPCDVVYGRIPYVSERFFQHVLIIGNSVSYDVLFLEDLARTGTISAEYVRMGKVYGLLLFVFKRFYFFSLSCGKIKLLSTAVNSQNKKLVSVNPVWVYYAFRTFGIGYIPVASLAARYSLINELNALPSPTQLFKSYLRFDEYNDPLPPSNKDYLWQTMPFYEMVYDEVVQSGNAYVLERPNDAPELARKLDCIAKYEWALSKSARLDTFVSSRRFFVLGGNVFDAQIVFSKNDLMRNIKHEGTLYSICFSGEQDQSDIWIWKRIIGAVGCSDESKAYAYLVGFSEKGISYFVCEEEDTFYDRLVTAVRRLKKGLLKAEAMRAAKEKEKESSEGDEAGKKQKEEKEDMEPQKFSIDVNVTRFSFSKGLKGGVSEQAK